MSSEQRIAAAALACVAMIACKSNNQSARTDSAAGSSAVAATAMAPPSSADSTANAAKATSPSAMTDANILAKADAGDSAEVAIAKYARANSTNARVKSYASELERDHGKGISKVESTAKKLGLALQLPAGDTTSQAASHALDHLKSLTGHDLDTAFVNHEIADHQHDIDEAKEMTSAAQKPEVKSLLDAELPELRKHLADAQKLSTSLTGSAANKK